MPAKETILKWFELNYFHGWLISNVADSTNFYTDNTNRIYYRPANKFMAANMFTFTPLPRLKVSFGNSIIYAERNIQAGYLIPIAFYKSIDHLLTKGTGTENQNSQVYFNISSRNIKHLHLFASVLFDEVSFSRFLPDNNCAYYTQLDETVREVHRTAPPGAFVYKCIVKFLSDKVLFKSLFL